MFKRVKINSFRSISTLEIDDLKRVNLFVGKNNCGKTSVLEGIYLLSNPLSILNLVNIRNFGEKYDFETISNLILSMFRNMDVDIPIEIEGDFDTNIKKKIEIEYDTDFIIQYEEFEGDLPIGLKIKYIINGNSNLDENCFNILVNERKLIISENKSKKSIIPLRMGLRIPILPLRAGFKKYSEVYGVGKSKYLSPKINLKDMIKLMDNLQISKEIGNIIKTLQKIEPSIKDLRIGAYDNIYCDTGAEKLMPINVMGDGLLRMLSILLVMYNAKDGYVFIDEIENGLHYSSLEVLWKGIFEASKEFNVQVFATTHSWECIAAYRKVYDEYVNEMDGIRLYRIEKEDDDFIVIDYDEESMKVALEEKWEMR
ncbi:ATPase-like protein [Methanocaldococcus lauensis]|uniref:ATPase-like protein n=1 Tax=Methanocaldococcus lauensis TaxID=2546128 RepID=A0A8D6PU47_9EURY|nr:AAA family ATPase [Methanocaldococcus lauensis]CAB3288033.1 ATPase-like protein [Methanocaldococcus lauensis]